MSSNKDIMGPEYRVLSKKIVDEGYAHWSLINIKFYYELDDGAEDMCIGFVYILNRLELLI